ncbi:MAG TPA: MurR/RpiR family transcriptional regulator [Gaiellaceae bacterium]|nr:MurR/RpiR family transcriptional regulator [Gaiellaceae bacterium]
MSAQGIVVRATSRELSPKERAVAEFYVEHREEAAFLSAAEIAARLGTSDATVVRAVKALGYSGIPELRRELIDALRAQATPAVRLGRSLEDAGEDPLGHVVGLELELLEHARSLDRAGFERAVDALASAQRVLAFGLGPTGPLCEYFALRLNRFGRAATAITESGLLLADALLAVRRGDALVLIAHERLDRPAEVTLRRANDLELPVVLLTDTLAGKLADRVSVALVTPRSRGGSLTSSAATIAILEALLLALAARDRARSLAALAELNELRKQLRVAPLEEELR